MKLTIYLTLLVILSNVTLAEVFISQVVPDPIDGIEFIELYNDGFDPVNLTGWVIETEKAAKDAILKGIILPHSHFIVADPGMNASHEEVITLYNKDSGIALFDSSGAIKDAVGWGDEANIKEGLWEGTPAVNPSKGKSLARVNSTNNNFEDFIETIPIFIDGVSAEVIVGSEDFEWSILPGQTKFMSVNGNSIVWLNKTYTSDQGKVEIPLEYFTKPGNYDLSIDGVTKIVKILPTKALEPVGRVFLTGSANSVSITDMLFKNIGNTPATPIVLDALLIGDNATITKDAIRIIPLVTVW